jgi:hypothetical protein
MIKLMLFIRRKEGLTREEFRARYESGRVPLAVRELPHLRRYHRNYVQPMKGLPKPDFDVCTEFWFDDWEGSKAASAYARDPVTGRVLAEDEAGFMDRSSMRFVLVEEEIAHIDAMRTGEAA